MKIERNRETQMKKKTKKNQISPVGYSNGKKMRFYRQKWKNPTKKEWLFICMRVEETKKRK